MYFTSTMLTIRSERITRSYLSVTVPFDYKYPTPYGHLPSGYMT